MKLKKLENIFKNFETYILKNPPKIQSFHPYYEKALWEMLQSGGKRFRPNLLLSIVYAYCPKQIKNAFAPALALETLHTYSLIHDDLPSMDNASLRRGIPTLHTKYDEVGAILVGDGLNTYSFYLISISKLKAKTKAKLIQSLSYNGGIFGMVLGQALDCYFENQILSLDKLQTIHLNKTAKLIAAALEMGGIISQCDKKTLKNLYTLGLNLGLFFQIRDDIIDITQSTKQAGKTTQQDFCKNSYVNLLGLEKSKQEALKMQLQIQKQLNFLSPKAKEILQWLLKDYFKV